MIRFYKLDYIFFSGVEFNHCDDVRKSSLNFGETFPHFALLSFSNFRHQFQEISPIFNMNFGEIRRCDKPVLCVVSSVVNLVRSFVYVISILNYCLYTISCCLIHSYTGLIVLITFCKHNCIYNVYCEHYCSNINTKSREQYKTLNLGLSRAQYLHLVL